MRSDTFRYWTNWNRNFLCRPERFARPRSTEDVAGIVRDAARTGRTVRPVGSGYSYTPLVQSDHVMVTLDAFDRVERVDLADGIAVVGAGMRLDALTRELATRGAAFANLGDIDRQTVAGAIGTGTHGTGLGIGSLSSRVRRLTLVDGRGTVRELGPADSPDLFPSACVSLGALGIVTSVTIQVEPMYNLLVERGGTTFDAVLRDFDRLARTNRNFEFFWFPSHGLAYVKKMNVSDGPPVRVGALSRLARAGNDILVENGLVWLAAETVRRWPRARKPWLDLGRRVVPQETAVVPADRAYATPRYVRHYEVEYALPYSAAAQALAALDEMLGRHPVKTVIPVEVRCTAADDLPLSMSQGRDVMYVAVHAYRHEDYGELFDRCEDLFLRFDGRPHWGKMHSLQAEALRKRYERWDEYQRARRELDPDGVFMNGYLRRILHA